MNPKNVSSTSKANVSYTSQGLFIVHDSRKERLGYTTPTKNPKYSKANCVAEKGKYREK
jgi:hypothetical protein